MLHLNSPSRSSPFIPLIPVTGWLSLHWKATKGKHIHFAIQARPGSAAHKAGWFAVGWSPNGDMGGSNVVAYETGTGTASPYDLQGESAAVAATSWAPGSLDVTTGKKGGTIVQFAASPATSRAPGSLDVTTGKKGGTIVKFTRSASDGSSVKVRNSGGAHVVFAYGPDSNVAMHADAEHTVLDFSCGCGFLRNGC
ncbi:unnamed protein product [Closterium sp. NIES-65]|nr:unnamed protein product [Closterium sp. NIES-65]